MNTVRSEQLHGAAGPDLHPVQAMLAVNPVPSAILRERRVECCNALFETLFGYGPGELDGAAVREHYADEAEYLRVGALLYPVIEQGGALELEVELKHRSGRRIPSLVHLAALRPGDPGGALILTVIDIGARKAHAAALEREIFERRLSEKALADGEARFRDFSLASTDLFWEADADGRLTWVSEPTPQALGIPLDQLLGKRVQDVAHPDPGRNQGIWSVYAKARQAHAPIRNLRIQILDPLGRWFSFSATATFDEQGAFKGYRGSATDVTKEVLAQHALQASEARFRGLTMLSSDWYWEQDAEYRFVEIVRGPSGHRGLSPDVLLGKRRWEIPRSEILGQRWDEHRALLAQRAEFHDLRVRRSSPDGLDNYVIVSGEPIFDALGRFSGYRGVGRDVTAQVRAESALRESQRQMAALMAHLPGAAYRCHNLPNWPFEFASQGLYDLTGYPAEEFTSGRVEFIDLLHPEDRDLFSNAARQAIAQRQPYSVEYRIRNRLGGEKWVQDCGAGMYDDDGEVRFIAGFAFDITTARNRQADLERQALLLKTIFEAMGEGIVVLDKDRCMLAWNQRSAELSGVDPALMGEGLDLRGPWGLITDGGADEPGHPQGAAARRIAEIVPTQGGVIRSTRTDGRSVEIRSSPIQGGGFVVLLVDVTERLRHENELSMLNETLEMRVRERTASLEASEKRLRAMADVLPMLIACKDRDGRVLMCNRAGASFFGMTVDEMIGSTVPMLGVNASVAALLDQADRQARTTGTTQVIPESRVTDLTGRERTYVSTRIAFRYSDEHPDAVLAVSYETTDMVNLNAQLARMSARLIDAQEEERRRISRDLHDQVGQILTALKMQLGALAQNFNSLAAALAEPLELADEALRHTRDLTTALHPHLLDDLGLEPALRALVQRYTVRQGLRVALDCQLAPAHSRAPVELVAYRVVQEALTNVVRHAKAARAEVLLRAQDGLLEVLVRDDGIGFANGESWVDRQSMQSIGVAGMRQRVTQAGGTFGIEAKPGAGTHVRAVLPW